MVTGSNFLLDTGAQKILIDCGLAQGTREAEAKNWEPFQYDPKSVSTLIVTHAHIDHIGRIPKLVRDGFKGKIISTEATKSLALPMLYDALELTERVAKYHNGEVLYEAHDIEAAMRLWEEVPFYKEVDLGDKVTLKFFNSGHILGSAMARFTREGKILMFTGDLGGGNSPLIAGADAVPGVTYLVIESVYGDRLRQEDEHRREQLEDIIENTAARGGTLLIPAFSAERTQDLLFEIRTLMTEKRVPSMPVYLDSPLAEKITEAYLANPEYFAPDIAVRVKAGEKIFSFPELRFVEKTEESRALQSKPSPKIIIAGSGMSTGGRGVEHEKYILPDPTATLMVCGYQSAGSLGRRLMEGQREVEIQGKKISVRCHTEHIYGYSAHMDGEELLEFVNSMGREVTEVFVVMGEPASSAFLAQRIRDYLGVRAAVPQAGEQVTLDW